MPVSVTMPRLGESVTEGTVTRWLKAEGDHVDADEPLLEVSTDKVDTEVPSPASGTVLSIKVQEDETVEIGVELAVIGEAGDDGGGDAGGEAATPEPAADTAQPAEQPQQPERASDQAAAEPSPKPAEAQQAAEAVAPEADTAPAAPQAAAPEPPAAPASAAPAASAPTSADDEDDDVAGTYVTPLVRRLASEHGVDLSTIQGTGVGGRIRKSDVLSAAEQNKAPAPAAAPAPARAPAHAAQAPAAASAPEPAAEAPAAAQPPAPAPAPAAPTPAAAAAQRGRVEPMSRMRQVIASRMVESLQTSAQLTTVVEVDVTKIARLRDQAKRDFEAREGVKLSFLPFFAVAAILSLIHI